MNQVLLFPFYRCTKVQNPWRVWSCSSVGKVLTQDAQSPRFHPQHCINPTVMIHTCDPSTWAVEAGGQEVQGHSLLYSEFGTSLGYMNSYIKKA